MGGGCLTELTVWCFGAPVAAPLAFSVGERVEYVVGTLNEEREPWVLGV